VREVFLVDTLFVTFIAPESDMMEMPVTMPPVCVKPEPVEEIEMPDAVLP
jgi:hypothetical protein